MMRQSRLIDISLPISESLPVWPGDAPVQIDRSKGVPTVSTLRLSSHTGTHLDAPAHFFPQGRTVDQLPLETLVGPAWVAEIIQNRPIGERDLDNTRIPAGIERLLLKTVPDPRPTPRHDVSLGPAEQAPPGFNMDFVALDESAGRWLLQHLVRLVGIEAPSIDPYSANELPVHRLLLAEEIIIVENLHLQNVKPGLYRLICLPLPYEGGDGAPVRAVLEIIE